LCGIIQLGVFISGEKGHLTAQHGLLFLSDNEVRRMNSQTIEAKLKVDPQSWKRWPDPGTALSPSSVGVYVLRRITGSAICRVRGTSEILYVGSGNIQNRLRAHYNPDWGSFKDSGWLISLVANGAPLEVIWQEMPAEDARLVEGEILQGYLLDHRELPPANRQIPEISFENGIVIAILSLDEATRGRVMQHLEDRIRFVKPGGKTE
jgi:hypothetical protein